MGIMKKREGYIRYIGKREFHHGMWYGIELIKGQGPNDGTEHGKRYFACKPRQGIFVRLYALKQKVDKSASDPRRINRRRLPLLASSKTLSDHPKRTRSSTSSRSRASTSTSISSTPIPSPSPFQIAQSWKQPNRTAYKLKLNNLSISNQSRPKSTRSQKASSSAHLSPWNEHKNIIRPKSARASKSQSNKASKPVLVKYPNNKHKKKTSNIPSFTLPSPRTPRQSPSQKKGDLSLCDIVDQSSETSDNDSSGSEYMSNQLLGTPKQQRFGFEDDSLCTNNGVILPMDRAQSMQIHKRSKSKKLKKKKRKKKKNVQRVDANQHVRSISIHSNIDEIESYKEYKRRRSKQQQLKKRKEQKETNRIKKYDQRQGFHRRQSKTVDFNMSRSLKHITEESVSSDDDICTLPSLQSTKSASRSNGYSFSVHINKQKNDFDENDLEEKQYQINTETVPLTLRQSYSLSSNGNDCSKHPRLSLAVNDENIDAYDDKLSRRESQICHEYEVNESADNDRNKYQSLIERNKLSLLKKTKSFKSKIYESDSDGLDDCFDDTKEIKFLSRNNYKNKRRSKSFCLSEFQIDESVIEYHVPSVVQAKKRRNKNIKINIHINNDIIAKDKRQKIKKKECV